MQNKKTLSVVFLAKNETDDFEKALKSAQFADEIIILLDSPHSLETEEIAKKYTKKISENEMKDFATQKNLLFKKATCDWVFLLDADEEISVGLKNEIEKVIESGQEFSAFWIPEQNIIFGKWIRHTGWYPDKHIRFFQNGKAHYVGSVHEQLVVDGKTGELKNHIIHHSYKSVSQCITKQNLYSDLEAKRVYDDGRRFSIFYLFGKPAKEFFTRYFTNLGFLDGWHGFLLSILMAIFRVMVAIKVWDIQRTKK